MTQNSDPIVFVVCGAGGVGKGTIVAELVSRDASLHLSRSWTTRGQRAGEADDAYVYVTEEEFEALQVDDENMLIGDDEDDDLYDDDEEDVPPGELPSA